MGVGDFFLGSGAKPTKTTDKQQRRFRAETLGPMIEELLSGVSTDFPDFGGSPLETLSLAGLENIASGQGEGAGSQLQSSALPAVQSILDRGPGSPEFEEFFRTNIRDPISEFLAEDVIPTIDRQSAARGELFQSTSETRRRQATEDVVQELSRARARAVFENEAMRLEAARIAPAVAALTGIDISQLVDLISVAQGMRQEELQEIWRRLGLGTTFGFHPTQGGPLKPGEQGFLQGLLEAIGGTGGGIGGFGGSSSGNPSSASASGALTAELLKQIFSMGAGSGGVSGAGAVGAGIGAGGTKAGALGFGSSIPAT